MSTVDEKKLLVTLDDSRRAVDTVRYLAQMPSFSRMQLHFFHTFAGVPETYWDLQREPSALKNVSALHAWETQHRAAIEKHLEKCRDILLAHDVHPKNIHVHIRKRKRGVARDIIAEAAKGYEAVVLRRRGLTRLQSLVMGSTALKLLNGLTGIPLVFAGRMPGNPRVLIACDGSNNALRAVDFAGKTLVPGHHTVIVASVMRTYAIDDLAEEAPATVKNLTQMPLDVLQQKLEEAVDKLRNRGFAADAVETRIVTEAVSRAGTIVELAEKEEAGTIVVGRRGHSKVREFAIGRVSSKILQLSSGQAVWVVN
ncbi:MAG: universal stress protein [Desulfosarcinaceae bacterium]